jgi:hypothetical protein
MSQFTQKVPLKKWSGDKTISRKIVMFHICCVRQKFVEIQTKDCERFEVWLVNSLELCGDFDMNSERKWN